MEAFVVVALLAGGIDLPGFQHLNSLSSVDTLLREEYVLGSFTSATRVVVSPKGWSYVAEGEDHRVHLFTSPAAQPRSVGGFGWGTTSFDRPTGLTTDGLNLYVADYHNHRIQRFDRNLNFLSTFSTRDTNVARVRFGFPTGVALSRQGDLFVLEAENIRVLKFTPQLQLERTFGGLETERGRLQQPIKILVSREDRVYILEPHRIVEFDYFGNVVRTIGEGVLSNARGFDVDAEGLLVVTDDVLHWFSKDGRKRTDLPVSSILASVPLAPLRDVALRDGKLFLLTTHHLVALTFRGVP